MLGHLPQRSIAILHCFRAWRCIRPTESQIPSPFPDLFLVFAPRYVSRVFGMSPVYSVCLPCIRYVSRVFGMTRQHTTYGSNVAMPQDLPSVEWNTSTAVSWIMRNGLSATCSVYDAQCFSTTATSSICCRFIPYSSWLPGAEQEASGDHNTRMKSRPLEGVDGAQL